MLSRFFAPKNALTPILSRPSCRLMLLMDEFQKASRSMDLICEFGPMVTVSKAVVPLKAFASIEVTPLPIYTSFKLESL